MKINRKELLSILDIVKPGLAAKEMSEQSTSFIFCNNQVLTYNDEVVISHPIDIGLNGAVKAKELHALLNKSTEEEIELEIKEGELRLKGKKSRAGIALETELSDTVQSVIQYINKKHHWIPLPKRFLEAVYFCLFSTSTEITKPILTCLHVTEKYVESCDNFRLTRYQLGSDGIKDTWLLPAFAAQHLGKYKPIELSFTDKGWTHFRNIDNVLFSCRLLPGKDGQFPDLNPFIKEKGKLVDIPKKMSGMLERAGIFTDEGSYNIYVTVTLKDNWLTVKGQNQIGWFEEKARVRYKGEPIEFRVNSKFLQEVLEHFIEAELTNKLLKFKSNRYIYCCTVMSNRSDRDK